MDNINTNPTKELVWQAPEFAEYNKHPLWFVVFGFVIAGLVLFGVYTKSWTTAVTFLLLGIMGVVYASRKPSIVTITLDGSGIKINSHLYSYKVIKKFWIVYSPPEIKTLYIETSAYMEHTIKIELGNQNPTEVRNFLKQYLEEDLDGTETISDSIARKVRF